jgi:hypothetical protein
MITAFPSPWDAPEKLLAVEGHCALIAAWCVIKHYRRRTSADRLIRMCGHTPPNGVFPVGLAVALMQHGLDVTFHTEPDPDMEPLEVRFYQRAQAMRLPVLPPVTIRELLAEAAVGHIPIVHFDTANGEAHTTPLLGEWRGRLVLSLWDESSLSKSQFAKSWTAPKILRQCIIVRGRSIQTPQAN